jgi:hypothetical protein
MTSVILLAIGLALCGWAWKHTTPRQRLILILVCVVAFVMLGCSEGQLDNGYGFSDVASRAITQAIGK